MTVVATSPPKTARHSPEKPHDKRVVELSLLGCLLRGIEPTADSRCHAKQMCRGILTGTFDPGKWVAHKVHCWGTDGIVGQPWSGVDQVYLIQMLADGPTQPIKVGRSYCPERRLLAHRISSPFPLRLLASFPQVLVPELGLHHLLRDDRLTGEWFKESPRVWYIVEWMQAVAALYPFSREPRP